MSDADAAKVLEQIQRKQEEDAEWEAKEKRYQELKEQNRREQEEREAAEREQKRADAEQARAEKDRRAEQKKQDAEDARRRKKVEDVERNIERAKFRQESEGDAEKAREFREMAKKNALNKPVAPLTPITPGSIKQSIKAAAKGAVKGAPAAAGRATVSVFGGMANQLIAPNKQTFRKSFTQETKDISVSARTIARPAQPKHQKKTYATPVVRSGGIAVNPAYVDSVLLGTSNREPPAKRRIGSILSPLDRFSKMI